MRTGVVCKGFSKRRATGRNGGVARFCGGGAVGDGVLLTRVGMQARGECGDSGGGGDTERRHYSSTHISLTVIPAHAGIQF
jgi:hypothetical protein